MTSKQQFSIFKTLLKPAAIIWVVPFVISFFFYNREGELLFNFWIFKAAMYTVGSVTALLVLRVHYQKNRYKFLPSTSVLLFYNILFDLIVLVGLLGMDLPEYLITVVSGYIIFISLFNFIALKVTTGRVD